MQRNIIKSNTYPYCVWMYTLGDYDKQDYSMEKEISEFKNTAVVTLKREEKTKSPVEKLLYSGNSDFLSNELYLEYDLYINDEKIDGKYLYLYEGCILESKTLKEITEEDIINFLNEVMEKKDFLPRTF